MTRLWTTVSVMAALALLLAMPAHAQDGAKATDEAWIKAAKAGDVDALVALYAPGAVLYPPDTAEVRGTAAIRQYYVGMIGAVTVADATPNLQYITVGDTSISVGTLTMKMTPKAGGQPMSSTVRITAVARKIGGKWLYVADHASAPLPEPPPAKP
jgi:uncharacterized protein (TIGR02246 family)